MGKYTTPRVPIQTPMFDQNGMVTRAWIIFWERLGKVEEITEEGALSLGELKATFGLLRTLAVENDLTNHFICRSPGTFLNVAVNCKTAPTGSTARLVIEKSTNEGVSWSNIFVSPAYIELVVGDTTVQEFSNFVAAPNNTIAAGNLLRINCIQPGSTVAGKNIEVVLRWEAPPPTTCMGIAYTPDQTLVILADLHASNSANLRASLHPAVTAAGWTVSAGLASGYMYDILSPQDEAQLPGGDSVLKAKVRIEDTGRTFSGGAAIDIQFGDFDGTKSGYKHWLRYQSGLVLKAHVTPCQ